MKKMMIIRLNSILRLYLIAIAILGNSCLLNQTPTTPPQQNIDDPYAMIPIQAQIGWLGSQSSELSYSFSIGKTEITQSQFKEITGHLPSLIMQEAPSNPVVFVSFNDAVIFCNQLSKRTGLDTFYLYSNYTKDSTGAVSSITSLRFDFNSQGFRLPTETEWEYATRGINGFSFPSALDTVNLSDYAWFQDNSEGTLHDVCTKREGPNQICDASGNAMELVNDWYETLPEKMTLNYVGPLQPRQEHIVKGGSFLNSRNGIRLTNRKDTYAVYNLTKTSYLGFRIARGAITSPTYYPDESSPSITPKSPDILPPLTNVISFFGTPYVRTVWSLNNGNLQWIDWSESPSIIKTIPTQGPAWHPTISPDGKWVAWSTRKEGQSGESQIFVASLSENPVLSDSILSSAGIPRWWVDPITKKTFIVYVTSTSSNSDRDSWSKESTKRIRIANGIFIGEPEILTSQGSFNGGLSTDGTTLVSGYTDLLEMDLVSHSTSSLFLYPQNGKPPNSSSQVCNVSISPKPSSEFLFLDFGEPSHSTTIGRAYGIHEILFIAEKDGYIKQWIPSPKNREGWDYSEWSNSPNFAVAASFGSDEARDIIHAIDLPKADVMDLLEGIEFNYPNLWVIPKPMESELQFDSLFLYDYPASEYKALFGSKMRTFWKMRNELQIALVGSSRILNGVNPLNFSGKRALNLGYSGADLYSSIRQIKEYLLPHATNLETIVLSLDIDLLYHKPSWFEERIGNSPGYQYDQSHHFWSTGIPMEFDNYLDKIPNTNLLTTELGQVLRTGTSWGNSEQQLLNMWNSNPSEWKATLDSLSNLLADLDSRNINLIAVIFPQNPAFRNLPTPYLYGPSSPKTLAEINQKLELLKTNHNRFQIIDFHKGGYHQFGPEFADNEDHLNIWGADEVTRQLDSILHSSP